MLSIARGVGIHSRSSPLPVLSDIGLRRSQDLEGAALAEAVVCELHVSALQTVTVASTLNAMQHPGRIEDPSRIRDFIPRHTPMLLATRNWLDEAGLGRATIERLDVFFEELSAARLRLARLLADAGAIGWQRAEVLHRQSAATSWRLACRTAAGAIKALDIELRLDLPERYAETVPVLTSLLNSAAEGMQPCIDAAGRPFMPELPQRRRSARKSLFQACTVQHARRTVTAMVRDISSGGLGLEGVKGIQAQDLVVVEIESGRRFTGIVVWSKGRLSGVRFSTPLPPNDPLLFG